MKTSTHNTRRASLALALAALMGLAAPLGYTSSRSTPPPPAQISPDGLNVWSTNGPGGGSILSLAIDPTNPAIVYAGAYNWRTDSGAVFKSTDGGASWSAVNTNLITYALAIDPNNHETIYAGYWGGVFKSTDGGASWFKAGGLFYPISALALDPSNPKTIYASAIAVDVGAGACESLLFKSTDGGATWNRGVGTGFGYSCFDPSIAPLAVDTHNPATIYLGDAGGSLLKSTDGGKSVQFLSTTGLPGSQINTLVIDPDQPNTLYAGTGSGTEEIANGPVETGVYRSTDGGLTWERVGLSYSGVSSLAIVSSNPNIIYAGTFDEGVFKSTDRGATWTSFNDGLTDFTVRALVVDPSGTHLHAGTEAGVFDYQYSASPPPPVLSTAQFSSASYSVNEGDGRALITVIRNGDISGPAQVSYSTSDVAAPSDCNVAGGTAWPRCDYTASAGTLSFAAGETAKSLVVPIVDDASVESSEAFNLALSNPVGAGLGAPSVATVTIIDNDASPASNNPIDGTAFFVRQHYLDFLNREPEAEGFNYWTNILNGCGADADCLNRVRVEVSSRFFIELEFQQTGYLVMRVYRASLGRAPTYAEFTADRPLVQQSAESRRQFAATFTRRAAFLAEYPESLSADDFVAKLYDKAGISDAGARAAALQTLQGGGTRGDVLYGLVELDAFKAREYNAAFVRMQYYGYLRRDVDQAGYDYWINVLTNLSPNNYRSMICAFVNSNEYQLRFNSNARGRFTELDCPW